ncbi:magnesium protoporphyrin IX methyltransferase [Alterisphingorhabdus coralli]|uniref:Magnesium protoporphyrin IX methyltransferase n=1 Tax=Alterisphingorhabdus coralli TaxID=3071408 RepID=A0AA97I059_9SPHN|nr:magnesium protoporphyrin IX methyltransferase [Parasphingorhabdus sp. SCSIO 66989]WOE74537.1 magnesium protoporphyrin IX methyltransferase [Parasphingorhabdus sp. SCSIO 66989]
MEQGLASTTYHQSRQRLEHYFDQTARKAWEDLTSDVPVSGIRATVRAGRDKMRNILLDTLPTDMHGMRLLDAGCGTGALSIEAAKRGAHVVAVDVSQGLIDVAQKRAPEGLSIDWKVGDMRHRDLGIFDHVIAMDSLIHYSQEDVIAVLKAWSDRTNNIAYTFAPGTALLRTMHVVGKAFPRSDRSPAIKPLSEARLSKAIEAALPDWQIDFTKRVSSGFYKSEAMGMRRK